MLTAPNMDFLRQLAKGIAQQFGPCCEVVVHDLSEGNAEGSIALIENGHVTGRKVGDGASHVALEAMNSKDGEQMEDHLGYLAKTKDGKALKCSTIYIRDEQGKPVGIFAINYDITMMLAMEESLRQFTDTSKSDEEPERISRNVGDLLDELIDQSVHLVGKPVALMNKEDKVQAIRFLNDAGAFLITKSGDKICKFFGISKYTLYSYMDESK